MLLRLSSLRANLRAYPSQQQKLSGGNSCEMLVAVVGLEKGGSDKSFIIFSEVLSLQTSNSHGLLYPRCRQAGNVGYLYYAVAALSSPCNVYS